MSSRCKEAYLQKWRGCEVFEQWLFAEICKAEEQGTPTTLYRLEMIGRKRFGKVVKGDVPLSITLSSTPGNINRVINAFEATGVIRKVEAPHNGNKKKPLHTTEMGKAVWNQIVRPLCNGWSTITQIQKTVPRDIIEVADKAGLLDGLVHLRLMVLKPGTELNSDDLLISVRWLEKLIENRPLIRNLDRRLPSLGVFRRRHGFEP